VTKKQGLSVPGKKSVRSNIKCPPKRRKKKEVPRTSVTMHFEQTKSNEGTMGRNKLTIESACKHTHFTWGERLEMQYHYNGTNKYQKITSPTLLGKLFAKNERTIRRELRRGMVLHELGSEPFERWEYNAEYAQNDAESKSGGKGPDLKLGKGNLQVGEGGILKPVCHHPKVRGERVAQQDQDL
jgi:hypothetical protein